MRQSTLLVALLMTCSTPLTAALGAPADAPEKIFQGRDLFGLQYAADPQIRPDGRAVAYSRRSFDIMTDRGRSSIWLVDAESGAQAPLVTGNGSHLSPHWSPKGDRLAYVSTAEDGRPQLFVRWMQSGQTAKLAELVEAPDSITWSPDGKWLAFTMFSPDSKQPLGEAPPKPENAQWARPWT